MTFAQVSGGQKLHYALQPGDTMPDGTVILAGHLSRPLCNRPWEGRYRMTVNVPCASLCKNCRRVHAATWGNA